MSRTLPINDGWYFNKPGEQPQPVTLPHTWNAVDGQDGGNDYWRGEATYTRRFKSPAIAEGERVTLSFDGVAMSANVILNGEPICRHEGGFSTFRADITDKLRPDNELTVLADNSSNDRVYPQRADFTFYGGIYRDVSLIITPALRFDRVTDGGPGIEVISELAEDNRTATVTVRAFIDKSAPDGVSATICALGQKRVVEARDHVAVAKFTTRNAHIWDGRRNPYLYTATAALESGDEVSARFGIRRFGFDREKGFMLNGRPYPLRGVAKHQDRAGAGNALTGDMLREDMAILLELGANTVRLAHYQHAQLFYDLCDENGIIVWSEIPYITEHMPAGSENALSQLRELVCQCKNHPSIVCWGLSNEITAGSPITDDLIDNHRQLNELCHRLDPTRPTVMAHAFMLEPDSPVVNLADIASYNLYFGWYLGELEQNDAFFDSYHARFPERVIGLSEYGADANPRFHSPDPERGDYTEEYQCVYHDHMLRMIEARPYLWATHVWNLFDFAADGRDEGGEHGVNQKGLVTMDRRVKKDAFYLYKAAWSAEPFVHLCGSRYVDRAESETEIKVYTNQDCVTLYVDGNAVSAQRGKTVFTFSVPLTGEHIIEAAAGECNDIMRVRRVAEANGAYIFRKQRVINWFDRDEFRPDHYSVRDTMGELRANPQTAAVLAKLMERVTATRGDVAKSAGKNENLQRMMAGMTLESLLKQAGDAVPEEAARQLNAALQRIKKP